MSFFFNDTATTEIYTTDTLFPYTTLFRSNARLTYFYVPKVANPGTTASNYDKYRIGASNSLTSYNGGTVQVQRGVVSLGSGNIPSILGQHSSSCIRVTENEGEEEAITIRGRGTADLLVLWEKPDRTNRRTE